MTDSEIIRNIERAINQLVEVTNEFDRQIVKKPKKEGLLRVFQEDNMQMVMNLRKQILMLRMGVEEI